MSLIETIKESRRKAAKIAERVLVRANGKSEKEVQEEALSQLANTAEFFPTGWYDPPPGGVSVLFAEPPYERLQFDSIRSQEYWPRSDVVWSAESAGMFYMSPIDRFSGMIGDIGFPIYCGQNEEYRAHLRACYEAVAAGANLAEVGIPFNELFARATKLFEERNLVVDWIKTQHVPMPANLGHTVPGSDGAELPLTASFAELQEAIRTERLYINPTETFTIPPTYAFTFEARLTDTTTTKPNFFFHFIVTFDKGKKEVLSNFDSIFKSIGMGYAL